jgi:glucosamine--fructose-6-phosphate aminotransferase (isomerizing)
MKYQCYEDIMTQDTAWRAALEVVDAREGEIKNFFSGMPDKLVFTACGSPYYLGLANMALWREELGICVTASPASEIMFFPETILPRDGNAVLLTASRSGETTETIEAVKVFAERFPGRTVLVGCKPDSTLERLADLAVIVPEGYDDVIPQTKSFGSMYLACQYVAALVTEDEKLADALRKLPELLPDFLTRWQPVVRRIAGEDWDSAVFLGSGPLHGVAFEGALKFAEMSLTPSVAYHTLEVRHGPRSVIDEKTLVVGLGSASGASHEQQVLNELNEETRVLALMPEGGWDINNGIEGIALEMEIPEHALGLLYLPLLQLLAYHRAVNKGVNPDESHNLSTYIRLP